MIVLRIGIEDEKKYLSSHNNFLNLSFYKGFKLEYIQFIRKIMFYTSSLVIYIFIVI